MTTSTVTHRHAEQIARLFMVGRTLDYLTERGVYEGWTRDEALAVVAARGWQLDSSGRLPRTHRAAPTAQPTPPRHGPPPHAAARPPQPAPAAATVPTEPVRVGSVYIAALRGGDLGVDHTYQRPLDEARVARMAADWDPRMLGTIDVSDRGPEENPRYAVLNGQHRAAAAAKASELGTDVWLPCNVHEGLTVADEAWLMRELDRRTKKLSGFDHWRSRRIQGDPVVAAVERVAACHGLQLDDSPGDGVLRSYATAEKLHKLGGDNLLDQTLAVLRGAYDVAAAAYQGPLLMAVGQLLHQAADVDVERLTRALAANRPEKLRAAAQLLRDTHTGPLHALMAGAITTAYNRTAGPGPRLTWSR